MSVPHFVSKWLRKQQLQDWKVYTYKLLLLTSTRGIHALWKVTESSFKILWNMGSQKEYIKGHTSIPKHRNGKGHRWIYIKYVNYECWKRSCLNWVPEQLKDNLCIFSLCVWAKIKPDKFKASKHIHKL